MNEMERLLQASIDLAQKDQVIDALLDENQLLKARLHLMELRVERHLQSFSELPALLRPQI